MTSPPRSADAMLLIQPPCVCRCVGKMRDSFQAKSAQTTNHASVHASRGRVIDRFWRKAEQTDRNVRLGIAASPSETAGVITTNRLRSEPMNQILGVRSDPWVMTLAQI